MTANLLTCTVSLNIRAVPPTSSTYSRGMTVAVVWPLLNPNWLLIKSLCLSIKSINLLNIHFSNILEKLGRSEIGLLLSISRRLPFL